VLGKNDWTIIKSIGVLTTLCWIWFLCDFLVNIIRTTNVIFDYKYDFLMIGGASFLIWAPLYLTFTKSMILMRAMPSLTGVIFSLLLVTGVSFTVQTMING